MENPVIIFGANALGRAALEIFESNDIVVYGFLDDDQKKHGQELSDIAVLGGTDDDGYLELIGKKCEVFIALDDQEFRKSLVEMLLERRKKMPVNAIHSNTEIAPSAHIGHGIFINSGVVIGSNARVSSHCLLHTHAAVDYGASLGEFVQVGAGSVIGSEAQVADHVFIGSGVTIVPGVKIGRNARVGAGSVVVGNVEEGKTVFGNPANELRIEN